MGLMCWWRLDQGPADTLCFMRQERSRTLLRPTCRDVKPEVGRALRARPGGGCGLGRARSARPPAEPGVIEEPGHDLARMVRDSFQRAWCCWAIAAVVALVTGREFVRARMPFPVKRGPGVTAVWPLSDFLPG